MVRLVDLPKWEQEHLLIKCGPPLGPTAWVQNSTPLHEKRIALITTAGLYLSGDESFSWGDSTYRALPGDEDAGSYIMGQSSANFDRSGFQKNAGLFEHILQKSDKNPKFIPHQPPFQNVPQVFFSPSRPQLGPI
jgi:hypothetical protein